MSDDKQNRESPTIKRVFGLLDKWRHLPAYQLERRADIFFALYLPEVLGKCTGMKINPFLVPECPIKKEEGNRSRKADYLAMSEDGERAFLIELKTDTTSIDEKQIKFLKCAARKGIVEMICGVKEIAMSESVTRSPQIRGKYFHLFRDLRELGLVEIPNICALKNLLPKGGFRTEDYRRYIKEIKIGKCRKLEVVYIIPKEPRGGTIRGLMHDNIRQIHFEKFAEHIKKGKSDGIRHTFAHYLEERWAAQDQDAGSPNPKDCGSC